MGNLSRSIALRLCLQGQEERGLLLETMGEYARAAQAAADYGLEHKTTSMVKVHHGTYKQVRQVSPLGSQLVCSARAKAVEGLKSRKALGHKRPLHFRSKGAVRYDKRSSTLYLETGRISLSVSGNRRLVLAFRLPKYFQRYLDWDFKSGDLVLRRKTFWYQLRVEKEVEGPEEHSGVFIGIDRGLRHIAVTSTAEFYSGSHLRSVKHRNFKVRCELQKKGTRSAKRKLKARSLREKRFQKDVNHCISKEIVSRLPAGSTIVLEDLTEIRERISRDRKKRGGRRLRRELHSWAFWQLEQFIRYKAATKGVQLETVNPEFTSQRCSLCGHTAAENREGAQFRCLKCGYQVDSDLNASWNIRASHLLTFLDTSLNEQATGAKGPGGRLQVGQPNVASQPLLSPPATKGQSEIVTSPGCTP